MGTARIHWRRNNRNGMKISAIQSVEPWVLCTWALGVRNRNFHSGLCTLVGKSENFKKKVNFFSFLRI